MQKKVLLVAMAILIISSILPMQAESSFDLQQMIEQAPAGAKILIPSGTYKQNLVISKPITLMGEGGPNKVILESSHSNTVVIRAAAKISGITVLFQKPPKNGKSHHAVLVESGEVVIENSHLSSNGLASLAVVGKKSSAKLLHSKIAPSNQAGIAVQQQAQLTIKGCQIYKSGWGGVRILEQAQVQIFDSQISQGSMSGVYVAKDSQVTIQRCKIFQNRLAGVLISGKSNAVIENCEIYQNKYGIWMYQNGSGTVKNSALYQNTKKNWEIESLSTLIQHNNQVAFPFPTNPKNLKRKRKKMEKP